MTSSLHSIFFAAFDNALGPCLEFQAPEAYVSAEHFDSISEYMITKPDLCGKIVTVSHHALGRVMGCPIGLAHERYPRNQLLCCVGFVLDPSTDVRPFDAVLRKLAGYFLSMELERGFLSLPAEKAKVRELLASILHGLNTRGECFVRVGAGDTVALKLFPVLPQPPDVADHDVPLPTRDLDLLAGNGEDSGLDYAMRVILPHIDGTHCVRAIAERANVDVGVVKECCRHLLYYGCVALVDVFQYSNIYASQPQVQLLLSDRVLRDSALGYIASPPPQAAAAAPPASAPSASAARTAAPEPRQAPTFDIVFRIYAAFGAGTQIGDISTRAGTTALGIDDRRLVVFGLLHGLLARVHKYPVPLQPAPPSHVGRRRASGGTSCSDGEPQSLQPPREGPAVPVSTGPDAAATAGVVTAEGLPVHLLDGSRHLEELCCRFHCSQAALEAAIDARGGFVYVLK